MSELSNIRIEKHSRFPVDVLKFTFRGADFEILPGLQKEILLNAGWAFLGDEVPGSPDSALIDNGEGRMVKVGTSFSTNNPEVLKLFGKYKSFI